VLIAESDLNDPRVVRPPEIGGYGLAAQWSDDFHHALHTVLTGERSGYYADFGTLAALAQALTNAFIYDGRYSRFRDRRHGRSVTGLSGHRFFGYMQNHDQIGNRAQGERSSHLLSLGRLKIAAGLVLTSPFVPLLYQGEEWGASTPFQYFTDHEDAELGRAVSAGRRSEYAAFGWSAEEVPDPQDPTTYMRSRLDWRELVCEPHAGLLEWHRRLIRLRREIPALRDGRMDQMGVRFDENGRWLVLERGPVTVACNLAAHGQTVPLARERSTRILLASETEIAVTAAGVSIPAEAVVILSAEAR
jgi:maltooligosyltrehalose trehalohydrolase